MFSKLIGALSSRYENNKLLGSVTRCDVLRTMLKHGAIELMGPIMEITQQPLLLKRLGIDSYQEPIVYMRRECPICRSEGFESQARLRVSTKNQSIIATLNVVDDGLLLPGEMGLSNIAWKLLSAKEHESATVSYAKPIDSLSSVRAKIYGHELTEKSLNEIVRDITNGRYADVHLAAFVTACSGNKLNTAETIGLTKAMVNAGESISWTENHVMDKHCVGGLPGNRTTPIIVSIVAANGLVMPKTSSRAITSPSGTADTMETLMPVSLSIKKMRQVVEREGGCIVWGGAVSLSPADDILIRVERVLDIDSEGQLVASVLSKKKAAGSNLVLLDLPVGATAKVRNKEFGLDLSRLLMEVGKALGLTIKTCLTDGSQPIGFGIGPALEALDVLAVLQNKQQAPQDLKERALMLAGHLLEMGGAAKPDQGLKLAKFTLESGIAWKKFQAIADAQGGLYEPPQATYHYEFYASSYGRICHINNRLISRVAKLAGAPDAKAAGISLHCRINDLVETNQPLLTLHAETPGELRYAQDFLESHQDVIVIEESKV